MTVLLLLLVLERAWDQQDKFLVTPDLNKGLEGRRLALRLPQAHGRGPSKDPCAPRQPKCKQAQTCCARGRTRPKKGPNEIMEGILLLLARTGAERI